jgi:phage baseplate assembly protein W
MNGMDRRTGRLIEGDAHLAQSVADILTTPVGSRLQRRTYGSLLPELLDQPLNPTTRLRLYGAAATALMRWEPRLQVTALQLQGEPASGRLVLEIEGRVRGRPTRFPIPLRPGAP